MNIIGTRRIWLSLSTILVAICIISLFKPGLNAGIEYTGGTTIDIPLSRKITASDVRKVIDESPVLSRMKLKAQVQPYSSVNPQTGKAEYGMKVRTRSLEVDDINTLLKEMGKSLSPKYGNSFNLEDVNYYGVEPVVGKEMVNKAIWAVILSTIGILVYVSFRFEFKSGVAAVLALIHDVFIVIGTAAILRIEVNGPFLAAVLTIVGYSINDTIVVFDRIRENLQFRKKGDTFEGLVNNAIIATLRRSIYTALTTLLAILALYVFVPTIREFTGPMIVGLVAGTYSSIFIASPVWVIWRNWTEKQHQKQVLTKKAKA